MMTSLVADNENPVMPRYRIAMTDNSTAISFLLIRSFLRINIIAPIMTDMCMPLSARI